MTRDQEEIRQFWEDSTIQTYFEVLRQLIAKKSIYAQGVGLLEVAQFLAGIFEQAGARVVLDDSYPAPFVLAEFKSSNPQAKTIIFYNHYDTVPADGDQAWTSDPFTLTVRDDVIYGRGVDDDKGHITARLSALVKVLQDQGDLPVNVIFIMEGAEESASVDLDKYLAKYCDHLSRADLLIWEQGNRNSLGQLEIYGGNKGIVTFDASVKSADLDIHSSYGGVVESSIWYLMRALNSLRREDGSLAIEGLTDDLLEANERELALISQHAQLTPEKLKAIYGLELPLLVEEREAFLKRFYFEPSLAIEGLWSGYQGQGVKTILPGQAQAKLEIRLVPHLSPQDVFNKVKAQLVKNGFEQVDLTYTLGEKSYRSDMSHPAIVRVIDLAAKYYPEGLAILPTSAGTGPMHTVFAQLGVPIAAFGMGNANSRDHAGDENVRVVDYYRHVKLVEELIKSYG
ncbi:M20/M25/M40 family metallo-hydrolase [Streptococcus cuniculipharyngis]|uniref:M20/M25/M40 family metallo-hydrolase n=1 Tax=Streptococcus cuniculipharyngis TaxID=1562651 RepID=A0A5C5SDB7_9STRE|nr:M20/M25/M40 family metallo-hydrolase [Streptococcus cuniculipharyngis]TWS98170.1 M20/M25/M40 family metallo-hydrolase [Streptococcus cuniculipharyngis]